jgi:hypothetical protein
LKNVVLNVLNSHTVIQSYSSTVVLQYVLLYSVQQDSGQQQYHTGIQHSDAQSYELFAAIKKSNRKLRNSYRLQATGYRLQATGYRLQATGYRLQATGYSS